ncbi:unnamed protein product [Trichobilharzia szidati]|nr:unnamed protein product [Trichobilharzia szidati]
MVQEKTGLSKVEFFVSGVISGFVARATVQPLDVLKTRFQLQMEPIKVSTASKYQGLMQAVKCIYREEGVSAFWKGHLSAQMQSVMFTSTQFLSFEVLSSWLQEINSVTISNDKTSSLSVTYKHVSNFVCGCGAGAVATAFSQPFDLLRTRFIAQGEPKIYKSLSHAAICILTREGPQGFFRGLVPSLLLLTPQTGMHFAIYHAFNQMVDLVRDHLNPDKSSQVHGISHPVGAFQSFIAGGIAGVGAKCVIYPLDMARSRMQVRGFEEARAQFGQVPKIQGSLYKCLAEIWKVEGAAAIFKGLKATLLKSFVSISCRFAVYEQVCKVLLYYNHS